MLRRRFLLSFLPLPLLFLGVGMYGVFALFNLDYCVKDIVERHLDAVIAAERMQEATGQMGESMARFIQDNDPRSRSAFEQGAAGFDAALTGALQRRSTPGEERLSVQLRKAFEVMRSSGLALSSVPPAQRVHLVTAFNEVKARVRVLTEQMRSTNSEAIRSSVADAANIRTTSTIVLCSMMLVATLLWLLVSLRLSRSILQPVRALIGSIQAAGENQSSPAVTSTSTDEMGILVEEFNKMAARLEIYRNSTAARMVQAQRVLHATLAAMPDPVYVVRKDLQVELRNAAAKRWCLDDEDGLPGPLRDRAAEVLLQGKDYLPRRFQEALVQQIDREPRYFLPKIFVMRDESAGVLGAAIVLEDVTQFRLLDELKSNFVSTVSHEIKTPLTSIRMAVHLLQEGSVGELQPRQSELLKTAREDIERLLRLLNNLLDLAHFEHGSPGMSWETVCVSELVLEAVKEVRTLSDSRSLRLRVECAGDLPDLYIDRARISHVLRNLLTNAIKHSPEGAEILCSAGRAENGGVRFLVKDRGAGIPKTYHERIFERFFRVPGQSAQGSGLGLSIAREIILAHTGSIGCESEPGRETCFFFCLPSAEQHQQRLQPDLGMALPT